MRTDEAELTWLRREFAQPGEVSNPDACPPPERLWDAVRGALPPEEMRGVVEHVALCAACAEEWRLALALVPPAAETRPEAPWVRRRGALVGLLAASLVAATIAGPHLLHRAAPPDPGRSALRGEGEAIASPDDGRSLPRAEFLLHWNPVGGTLSSDVAVFTDANEAVAQAEDLRAERYQVPATALRSFPSGSTLYWTVTFNLPAGRQQVSPVFKTRIR